MFTQVEDENRRLLRARDAIDRSYADDLDIATLARIALMSPSHFIRRFRAVFGETPHRYLQRRRIDVGLDEQAGKLEATDEAMKEQLADLAERIVTRRVLTPSFFDQERTALWWEKEMPAGPG